MDYRQEIAQLRETLNEAGHLYYVLDAPTMSDFEYDRLLRRLEELEAELPRLEERKRGLEEQMSSGTMAVEELLKASTEITALIEEIDLKTLRWMELSEKN